MIFNNKFKLEEIVTWFTFDLMHRKENFVMLLNKKDVLTGKESNAVISEREYKDWLETHSIFDEQERIFFVRHKDGYSLHYTEYIKDVLIPNDLLELKYNEFLDQVVIED